MEKVSVRISQENKDRIANFGKGGESIDTCLSRALDLAEETKFGEKGKAQTL